MALNYKKIAELSQGVVDYQNAIDHIQELAKTLMEKENDIDVEIMIREAIKQYDDGRNNAGSGIELQQVTYTIFQMAPSKQYQSPTHTSKGLKQNGMPNSVGLIMLEHIKNWYVESRNLIQKELETELKVHKLTTLKVDYTKLNVGEFKHTFEG
jgi:hypothetical protein